MPKIAKTILGVLLAITLSAVFFFEMRYAFGILKDKMLSDVTELSQISRDAGTASVSIRAVTTYPEIEGTAPFGSVIPLYGYGVKVQLDGRSSENTSEATNTYKYTEAESQSEHMFTVEAFEEKRSDFITAVDDYFHDSPYGIFDTYGITYDPTTLELYQQTTTKGKVPMVYNQATLTYYMFIPTDDNFLVATASDPFLITDSLTTSVFGDPSEDPMTKHTYSEYEKLAAENTIRKLMEEATNGSDEDDTIVINNPYADDYDGNGSATSSGSTSSGETGSADAYTSPSDNNLRAQLASYANYDWKKDGTADGTTLKISTTSQAAKDSQWSFTETTYSFSYAGLRIQNMSGQRKSTSFTIEAEITNELKTPRPFVVVVKYINDAGDLLGVDVIDSRSEPLDGESFRKISSTVSSAEVAISEATAVQFEVY